MRIALISMHTSPSAVPGSGDAGGMNVVVAEAAHALVDRGHDVTVVTRASTEIAAGESALSRVNPPVPGRASAGAGGSSAAPGAPSDDPGAPSARLVALPAGPLRLPKHELPGVVPEFAAGLRALGRFDAVHAHYWLSAVAAREAFGNGGEPGDGPQGGPWWGAVTFHTLAAQKNARLAPGDTPEPASRVIAERELAAGSFVVAGSRSELDAVERLGASTLGRAIVTPGVDTHLFRPHQLRDAVDPPRGTRRDGAADPLRITVLGRVQPLKGQDLAVRAAGELARLRPDIFARTEWVIAGEPTPGAEGYSADLRTLAEQLDIAANIRFLPAQSRTAAADLLAGSTLVLVPSHSETFGLTALEAAACGVPVIAGAHTGLVEAVPDGVAAVLLADRDPRSWATAIAGLLEDDDRRARLGASARLHALSHDWGAHAAKLERIYERLAN